VIQNSYRISCARSNLSRRWIKPGSAGQVVIGFIVEKDGSVSNVKIRQSVSPELDAEALRLFRMLLWEPAVNLGQPVASENEFPIILTLKSITSIAGKGVMKTTEYPYRPSTHQILYTNGKDWQKALCCFSWKRDEPGKVHCTKYQVPWNSLQPEHLRKSKAAFRRWTGWACIKYTGCRVRRGRLQPGSY